MANLAPLAESSEKAWPTWAKLLASLAIGWQVASLLAAEFGQPASASPLEHAIYEKFQPYYQLVDQGLAHRFYSDIGPTPILLAELRFDDGTPTRTVRIPDRSVRPRVQYQRQLALANAVLMEPRWAQSFAHHLCRREPGCVGVTIRIQEHRNPSPFQLIEAAESGEGPLDADSEEFYDIPRLIGDFPCPKP
jgi:hypothetical protein